MGRLGAESIAHGIKASTNFLVAIEVAFSIPANGRVQPIDIQRLFIDEEEWAKTDQSESKKCDIFRFNVTSGRDMLLMFFF